MTSHWRWILREFTVISSDPNPPEMDESDSFMGWAQKGFGLRAVPIHRIILLKLLQRRRKRAHLQRKRKGAAG
ncbi:hypothetical protein [Cupriavidus taiwanensis]|nr:hypothetical protein [Cupriavidus taiwanensis]